jgi:hypothetical protein
VKALAYIIGYLKIQMPNLMGREKKQQKLINDLPNVFRTIMKKYNLVPGDFPVRTSRINVLVLFCGFVSKEKHLTNICLIFLLLFSGYQRLFCQTKGSQIL